MHDALIILLVSALASARIAVLLAHDTILEPARGWLFRRFPPMDNLMIGMDYQSHDKEGRPLPAGAKRKWYMISELLTCTRCLTVWTTPPMVVLAWTSWPGLVIVGMFGAMSIASWVAKKV
jgi:hypothetical protein